MKKFRNAAVGLVVIGFTLVLTLCTYYNINMGKVSKDSTPKEVTIKAGSINSIATTLKENHLIKNKTIFKVYIYLTSKTNLKAGTYDLSEDMGVKKIVDVLEKGDTSQDKGITFKEGINVRKVATLISEKTNNSYEDVLNYITDSNNINTLISKYWFLTEDIKNSNIYYPLEGYLYPNTYSISKDTEISTIIDTMLNETDKQLSKYKDDIEKSKLSIHEIITLASIVELEVANKED